MSSFEIKGSKEFEEKLKLVEKNAPDRIINKLDEEGNKLKKAMTKNTPRGKTGKLAKSYRLEKVKKAIGGYEKGLYNKAPHHHLVNNGHRIVAPNGSVKGWVDGKFYIEKTIAEEETKMMNELDKWLEDLFRELK